jgi:2-succinyl-5-enolpyruvyl-6-hydroxy-3-cyclohexene-1-carboxylate synthase
VNPSSALATVLVDELVRHGVREAVLCPGSRSAPLAYALQDADREGRLRLHVRVDERSAGFLALGLGKLTGTPAVVVTTSGTAVANLHPAVLEAHHAQVPLVVLSADRPPELRGTGANQTTVQPGLFGAAVRWSADLGTPERLAGQQAAWRSTVSRALAAALGQTGADAGPVHLNLPLREPLVPTAGDDPWPEALEGRPDGQPWVRVEPDAVTAPSAASAAALAAPVSAVSVAAVAAWAEPDPVARTLVLIGDLPRPDQFAQALDWAQRQGWPVVAEPFGPHPRDGVVAGGSLVLGARDWLEAHAPDRVITVGRPTLSRQVSALLRRPGLRVETVAPAVQWADPSHVVSVVHPWQRLASWQPSSTPQDPDWRAAWEEAGRAVSKALLDEPSAWPSGLAVAATVLEGLPQGATLFVGSSNAVRDLDLAAARAAGLQVVASRGLAGIDGGVATAAGIALAGEGPTYALLGDLTFIHDQGGLAVGPHEPVPDLTIVVVNDDGGGIFTLLEPGEPERSADFERVFGTPLGVDLAALCAAHGVDYLLAGSAAQLSAAIAEQPRGLRVVEVAVDRAGHRGEHARLRDLAAAALR